MVELISAGVNFLTVLDECSNYTVTFKCKEDSIINDRVIEEAKAKIYSFLGDGDASYLFELYDMGWYIESVSG
jgi:hypothetical protein